LKRSKTIVFVYVCVCVCDCFQLCVCNAVCSYCLMAALDVK